MFHTLGCLSDSGEELKCGTRKCVSPSHSKKKRKRIPSEELMLEKPMPKSELMKEEEEGMEHYCDEGESGEDEF